MSNVVKLFESKSPVKSTTEPVKPTVTPTVKRRLNDVSPSEWDRVSYKYVTTVEKKWKKANKLLTLPPGFVIISYS